ncbi:MAG: ANTAR domain-containing protein [Eubacterium sp.]|nr:ANTAR domain-containing protein [Eubacterium sp.]
MGKAVERRQYSILIVSQSEQLNNFVKKVISDGRFSTIEVRKSAAQAAQELLNRHYDVVLVNAPLPDEFGTGFVLDICTRYTSGILVITPGDVADDVTERVIDYGVVVLAKPLTNRALARNLRHLVAIQNKMQETEKKVLTLEERIKEMRVENRAKCLLIEKEHMTEEDAHRLIGKQAMDRCISKRAVAEEIIEKYE